LSIVKESNPSNSKIPVVVINQTIHHPSLLITNMLLLRSHWLLLFHWMSVLIWVIGCPPCVFAWTAVPASLGRYGTTASAGQSHRSHHQQQQRLMHALFAKRRRRNSKDNARYSDDNKDGNNNDPKEDALSPQQARTDIRNFLTQRALQSFIFLLYNLRDSATIRWLQETYQDLVNIEHYHGTGALNLTKWNTWDSILTDMLFRENQVVVISAKRRRGQGGWSKNNPYIKEVSVTLWKYEQDLVLCSYPSSRLSVALSCCCWNDLGVRRF
jgi:hypothetical protein